MVWIVILGAIEIILSVVLPIFSKNTIFDFSFFNGLIIVAIGIHLIKLRKKLNDLQNEIKKRNEEEKPQKPIPGIRELTDEEFNELVKKQEEERKKEQKN